MKKIILLSIISCALFSTMSAQQIAEKSFFTNNNFFWNPAMTGVYEYTEISANYKQQWVGFNDAPLTASIGGQVPLYKRNMSLGAFIVTDKIGPLRNNSINFSYAYKLKMAYAGQLSIGLMGTLGEYHVMSSDILVNDEDDSLLPASGSSKIVPNAGVGVYYTTNGDDDFDDTYYYGGIAVNQLYPTNLYYGSNEANYRRTIHGNALLGARFINGDSFFEPSMWMNYGAENIFNINLGLKFEQYNSFWAAMNIGTNLTLSVQGGVILDQDFLGGGALRIGTQGTYNIGGLGGEQGVGYEFFTAYRFEN